MYDLLICFFFVIVDTVYLSFVFFFIILHVVIVVDLFYLLKVYHIYSFFYFFFFKQKTAYEMRISDWSSDVCSSDLAPCHRPVPVRRPVGLQRLHRQLHGLADRLPGRAGEQVGLAQLAEALAGRDQVGRRHHSAASAEAIAGRRAGASSANSARTSAFAVCRSTALPICRVTRSEEHTSELQSLMRISYAGFSLKKK